jgi:hypothetical protein
VVKSLGISLLVWRSLLSLRIVFNVSFPGGSTIVVLFEKGKVEWDEDLLINGRAALETLVRVGMGIGKGRPAVAGAV